MPKFNRAVIFDTTQNTWHGLSQKCLLPKDKFRKSLAIYYLCKPSKSIRDNQKALFAPRDNQKNKNKILDLIQKRSDSKKFKEAYRTSK